jgi:DNA-directed RNA polymerase specialized sigma24 family protein
MAVHAPHHSDALDAQLVLRAQTGDRDAFIELFRRHARPAWRLALAVSGSTDIATHAVAKGYTLSHVRLQRRTTTLAVPFRCLVTRASGEAAAAASRNDTSPADPAPNDLAEAFLSLPERWRATLWLTVVEGGSPAQIAPIIGLSEEGTASLVDRASAGLRARYARSTPLAAYFLRDLTDAKPKLRAIAVPMPLSLEADAVARWEAWQKTVRDDDRHGLATVLPLRPWAERALSAAAAAVFAVGLAAAINLGGKRANESPMLAAPAGRVEAASVVNSPATVRAARGVSLHRSLGITRSATGVHSVSSGATSGRDVARGGDGSNTTTADSPSSAGPAAAPDAPIEDNSGDATPSAEAGVTVADTPVAVVVGADGVGVTVGDTTVGNSTPTAPESGVAVVVDPVVVDPIGITLP